MAQAIISVPGSVRLHSGNYSGGGHYDFLQPLMSSMRLKLHAFQVLRRSNVGCVVFAGALEVYDTIMHDSV